MEENPYKAPETMSDPSSSGPQEKPSFSLAIWIAVVFFGLFLITVRGIIKADLVIWLGLLSIYVGTWLGIKYAFCRQPIPRFWLWFLFVLAGFVSILTAYMP